MFLCKSLVLYGPIDLYRSRLSGSVDPIARSGKRCKNPTGHLKRLDAGEFLEAPVRLPASEEEVPVPGHNVLAAKAKAEYDVAIVKWRKDQKELKAMKQAQPKVKKPRAKKKTAAASEGMRV